MKLAISGKKGHGKSTAAKLLADISDAKIISFADPLKEICIIAFGLPREYWYDPNLKDVAVPGFGVSPRKLMQIVGTELFRDHLPTVCPELKLPNHSSIWINILLEKVKKYSKCIVDDLRLPQESEALAAAGFYRINIIRPDSKSSDEHVSEKGCDVDEIVINDGSIDDLKVKLLAIINRDNVAESKSASI